MLERVALLPFLFLTSFGEPERKRSRWEPSLNYVTLLALSRSITLKRVQ